MQIQFQVKRFIPEKDPKPYWGKYTVEVESTDRVLDGLNYIKWNIDGSLTYRRSCAHGICGSDAMIINGQCRLACKFLLKCISQAHGRHQKSQQRWANSFGERPGIARP